MGKSQLALWLGVAVATIAGVGVAAYLILRQEREQDQLDKVQRLLERSQDIVQRIESELVARALPDSAASRS